MKREELRIGNWVKVDDLPEEQVTLEMFSCLHKAPATIGVFIGIPLTEEWLFKFDFVKTYAKECYMKQLGETEHYIYITLRDKENIFSIGDKYSFRERVMVFTTPIVQYLHEVQNLYFSLTGKELIKKNLTDYGSDSGSFTPSNLDDQFITVGSKVKVCDDLVTTITRIDGNGLYFFDDDNGEQKYAELNDLKLIK